MDEQNIKKVDGALSRRAFLKLSGTAAVSLGVVGILSNVIWLDDAIAAIPVSEGYLLVDTKKWGASPLAKPLIFHGRRYWI